MAEMTKTITIPNFNKKLEGKFFLHIGLSPTRPMSESEFPVLLNVMNPDNQIVRPVHWLNLIRFPILELPSYFTYLSHGMDRMDCAFYLIKNLKVPDTTEVAVYLYEFVD